MPASAPGEREECMGQYVNHPCGPDSQKEIIRPEGWAENKNGNIVHPNRMPEAS